MARYWPPWPRVWPEGGGQLILNVLGEPLLRELLQADLPAHIWLELPSFMCMDPTLSDALMARKKAGNCLLLKGLPSQSITPELSACFKYALLDLDEYVRGAATNSLPKLALLLSGVRSAEDITTAFNRNAEGVIGWPHARGVRAASQRG